MNRFKKILLIDDGDEPCEIALHRAKTLAENNLADLMILRIVTISYDFLPKEDSVYKRLKKALTDDWQKYLQSIIENAPANVRITGNLVFDRPFPLIIQEVLRNGHDLLIKCAENNSGIKNMLLGSVDMHLLRKSPCPVWIIHKEEQTKYRRILAAVDIDKTDSGAEFSGLNRQVLEMASSLALSEFCELHIVHAWSAFGEGLLKTPRFRIMEDTEITGWVEEKKKVHEQQIKNLMDNLSDILGKETMEYLDPKIHIRKGEPHQVISDVVEEYEADIVVMGTVARTGIPGFFMGNTAERILHTLDCSVLAVKPEGFVTPVTLEQ